MVRAASVPSIITYQGKLVQNNTSVTTTKAFGFSIYDASSGGSLLYTAAGTLSVPSTVNITPTSGIFSIDLGGSGTNTLDPGIFGNNTNLYLEVTVEGNTLSPRKQLTAAPFAINSMYLNGVSATTTSSTTYIPISNSAGNFTFTGTPGATVSGGVVYVNPDSAAANTTLLGLAVHGSERFRVDAEGDTWLSTLFASSSVAIGTTNDGSANLLITATSSVATPLTVRDSDGKNLIRVVSTTIDSLATATTQLSYSGVGALVLGEANGTGLVPGIVMHLVSGNGGITMYRTPTAVGATYGMSSIFLSSNGIASTTLTAQSFFVNQQANYNSGVFYVDSNGSTSASGTFQTFGLASFRSGFISNASSSIGGTLSVSSNLSVTGTAILNTTTIATRLGINSTTPGYNLSVLGSSYFSGGTTTFANFVSVPGRAGSMSLKTNTSSAFFAGATDMAISGPYAYVLSGTGNALRIFDITSSTPALVGSAVDGVNGISMNIPGALAIQGNYAYVVIAGGSLSVIDISNPAAPVQRGLATPSSRSGGSRMVVSGNYAYIADSSGYVESVDISDPTKPRFLDSDSYLNGEQNLSIALSGSYLFVGSATFLGDPGFVEIFDVSNPARMVRVSFLTGTDFYEPEDVAVIGNTLFFVSGNDLDRGQIVGLVSFDISNPTSPVLLQNLSVGALVGLKSLAVSGNYAYVSEDQGSHVYVIDIANPKAMSVVQTLSPGVSNITRLQTNGNYVYGLNSNSLSVFDASAAQIANATIGSTRVDSLQARALAQFDQNVTIRGGLSVGNQGLLLSGDFGIAAATSTLTATNTLRFSHTAQFLSSASTSASRVFIFDTVNQFTLLNNSVNIFSVRNNGMKLFSISSNGAVSVSGTISASSATVSTPGNPGDVAEKVDITPDEDVSPGDVLSVDISRDDTYQKSTKKYDTRVAGVVSTNPSITVGDGKTSHTAAMAVAGRVPVKVTNENGPIMRGDFLVTASVPGFAMRYDPAMPSGGAGIIGIAVESMGSTQGSVMTILKSGWAHDPVVSLSVAQNSAGVLTMGDMQGQPLINVDSIRGNRNVWSIASDGRFTSVLATVGGSVEFASIRSNDTEFVISGSSQLESGSKRVTLPEYVKEVLSDPQLLKISITLTSESTPVYISQKDVTGFVVKEMNNGTGNGTFDWIVVLPKKVDAVTTAPPDTNSQTNVVPSGETPVHPVEPSTVEPPPVETPQDTASSTTDSTQPVVTQPADPPVPDSSSTDSL